MNQSQYWDKVADKKSFHADFQLKKFREYVSHTAKILDYGCGYGRILEKLSNSGYQYLYGVDFSKTMIEIAHKNNPQVELNINDGENLLFNNNFFDAVILCAVLGCIIEDEKQIKLMDEILRVLKPNGIVYLTDFLITHNTRNDARYLSYKSDFDSVYGAFQLEDGAILRHLSIDHVKKLTNKFNSLYFEEKEFKTMNNHITNGFCFIGSKP